MTNQILQLDIYEKHKLDLEISVNKLLAFNSRINSRVAQDEDILRPRAPIIYRCRSNFYPAVAPTCKPNQTKVHGVAKQEKANISCQVDANPPEVQFKWTFNNSAESIDVAAGHIARAGTSSIVSYTPMTELDYGTLLCWASNHIGQQQVPCVYHIIPAGKGYSAFVSASRYFAKMRSDVAPDTRREFSIWKIDHQDEFV